MTAFSYRARNMNGLLVTGMMEADSPFPVRERLDAQGLIPLSVVKGGMAAGRQALSAGLFHGVTRQEVMLFTRQFHTLFKAGMNMENLLTTLAHQTRNRYFSQQIERIKADVSSGSSLANAFAQHPKIFDELYTSMIATGEEAGILEQVLEQLAKILEKETHLKQSVKSATLYPKIVVFVLAMSSTVLMTFVVPKFASFYARYDAELPLSTRMMIGTSEILKDFWPYLLVAGILLLVGFKRWADTFRGKLVIDRVKWNFPVFGPLTQKVANARYANIVGALYKAGLSITRALEISANTIGNEVVRRELLTARAEVEKGKSISEALRQTRSFAPLLVEATAIGEKSGSLDSMYFAVGEHFETEVNHTLKNLTTLLEPLLLFGVFGMVTWFALSIFLPMWGMSRAVLH